MLLVLGKGLRFVIISLVLVGPCLAQDAARMDQVVQSYVDSRQFMGSVLVARGETVLFSKGYSSANLEWNIPNTPTTKFRLGSITKQFTAACVLLLEERNQLKLEDPIKKYLPDAPTAWDGITIYHLLTHTSGIPNFTALAEYRTWQVTPVTVEQNLKRFQDKPLDFQPGEKMRYSNSGYIVLGALIEKVSGISYEKFVQDNIFTPVGMTNSGYDSSSAVITNRAAGYVRGRQGTSNAAYIDMSVPYAAGGLYSTTEDLLRWERALFGNKVISAASLKKMTTPFKSDYALGLMVTTAAGHRSVVHGGSIDGFNTLLTYYPDSQVTVVALANLNGTAVNEIVPKLGALAHGETVQLVSERDQVTVPVETLQKYVGTYSVAPNINLMIRLDGVNLTTQLSGQRRFPLFASSPTKFFLKVVDAELEFVSDADGKVVYGLMHQNGRDTKAMRTSDTVKEHVAITLPAATLNQYPGTYELRPGFDLVVSVESGQLTIQATGQPKDQLFAESERSFFLSMVDAQVEFEFSSGGEVANLILHQGTANLKAMKK